MENMSNEIISFIVLIIGISIGWALRGIWDSVRSRRKIHRPLNLRQVVEDSMREWKKIFGESGLDRKTIDAEYKDKKLRIVKEKHRSRL